MLDSVLTGPGDLDRLPESRRPWAALAIFDALITMAEKEPDPATLLSLGELDGLLRGHHIDAWLARVLERVPADWSVA